MKNECTPRINKSKTCQFCSKIQNFFDDMCESRLAQYLIRKQGSEFKASYLILEAYTYYLTA